MKLSGILGLIAGISSILLWLVFCFFNPYSDEMELDPVAKTFIMLFLPACLAILGSFKSNRVLMFISFIWALPISFYAVMTSSIFSLFGIACLAYLLSFLLMHFKK